ncbi:FAD-dependent monooxygenase [Pseudonocardia phyllosphaerae]|uniref:FAD-dependent monooxygenase n=1 Tax=Pseudonocardia phyllosphaerae TaxID=3390502 RepID=UPI00397CCF13
MTTTQVIVVGAGPTGLATAGELARQGVAVTVLDGAAGPAAGSRGKGIQPRTLELLDRWGVADRLVSLGRSRLRVMRWTTDDDGEPVGVEESLTVGRTRTDARWDRSLVLPQWRVEEVLRDHLAGFGVPVRWDSRVASLSQDTAGVRVVLDDGTELTADYLVGADGGSSTVRHQLGVSFLGETREDVRLLLGDLVVEGLERDSWHQWAPFVALCPLAGTDTFQFQSTEGVDIPGPLTPEVYQQVLDDAGAGHVRVREVRWSSRWRLNVRMVEQYRVGRVFLAGDAAHVHSPAGGQGMNTGIGDGINLGWKLAAVLHGAPESLLDSYTAERLPIAAGVLGLSTELLGRGLTRRGAQGETALQLDLSYRDGPLAAAPDDGVGCDGAETGDVEAGGPPASGARAGDVQAGDRMPDPVVRDADGRRIRLTAAWRSADTGWALVGFGSTPDAPAGVRAVTVLPPGSAATGADTVVDHLGHVADAIAPRTGELVLVRPDNYVALRTTDPARVTAYLAGVLPPAPGCGAVDQHANAAVAE